MEGGCENGVPGEEGGASQEAGSGGDVESRKGHGRSLWPTAKRFSPLPRKTHRIDECGMIHPRGSPSFPAKPAYAASLGGIGMGRITHPLRVPTPRTQEFGGE